MYVRSTHNIVNWFSCVVDFTFLKINGVDLIKYLENEQKLTIFI